MTPRRLHSERGRRTLPAMCANCNWGLALQLDQDLRSLEVAAWQLRQIPDLHARAEAYNRFVESIADQVLAKRQHDHQLEHAARHAWATTKPGDRA